MGPAIGGLLIFGGDGTETNKFASMTLPYMIIGTLVLLVAILFMFTKLPEIHEGEYDDHGDKGKYRDLLKYPSFQICSCNSIPLCCRPDRHKQLFH